MAAVERLGSLQFDPLEVAGRNHDLVLHARVAGYTRAVGDDVLYGTRLLYETYNKGLSLVPTAELPYYRVTWDRHRASHGDSTFDEHAPLVEELLERIRTDGPLSSTDFEPRAAIEWYWRPTNQVRAILEALAEAGILGPRPAGGQSARLRPRRAPVPGRAPRPATARGGADPAQAPLALPGARHARTDGIGRDLATGRRPARDLGADAPPDDRRDARRRPARRRRRRGPQGRAVRPGLGGRLARCRGDRGRRGVLRLARGARSKPDGLTGVTFLAPLDPFVWDRDFIRRLYDFDYVWEVYVPERKRRWGYYVLPLLFGDRLVGRIEPRIDRKSGAIRVLDFWWEAGFDPLDAPRFVDALADALLAHRRFAGMGRIVLPRTARHRDLGRELRPRLG